MITRRLLLSSSLIAVAPRSAVAQQRRSLTDPLRLGVDNALFDSGLARALQQGFGRDTGVAVQLLRRPALPLLESLDRGEVDAALTNTPDAESRLEQQGLAHDRHPIAAGDFVLVGPAPRGKVKDPAELAGGRDIGDALVRLRDAAASAQGSVAFVSAGDGSGTHLAEQALWRVAKVAPASPWYILIGSGSGSGSGADLLPQARSRGAYAIVERGDWMAQGGTPLAILVERDPAMSEVVHVMRSFRVNHPAGKMFVTWIAGTKGRRVVAGHRAYRTLTE